MIILSTSPGFAADFGAVLSAEGEYDSAKKPDEFSVSGKITPWISAVPGPALTLYGSASISLNYEEGELQPVLFELDRTELTWRPVPAVFAVFGRQQYGDNAGLIASGLFDGVHGSWSLGFARLSFGAFYTGLLYKEQAEIIMVVRDLNNYARKLDYGDLDTYFASRRILIPFGVEFTDLSERSSLALNLIGQFDVNGYDSKDTLHSQYLEARYLMEIIGTLNLNLAVAAGLAEDPDMRMGFAASAGADWELPTAVQDLLSFRLLWSSGKVNDSIGAFFPVSGITPGEIFTPRLQALIHARAAYRVRPFNTFSVEGGLGYFIRTDLETLQDEELDPSSDSRLLGGEFYASLVWVPQSVLRFTAEGGAFFPGLGGAFVPDADIRWKASLSAAVSF
jgi:hypothetical protein